MSGREWAELIEKLLYARELSPKELAERCGLSPATVSRWIEKGVYPRAKSRQRLCRAFGCASLEELRDRVEEAAHSMRLSHAGEVGDAGNTLWGRDDFHKLRFLLDPSPEEEELIQKIPAFSDLRETAVKSWEEGTKPWIAKLEESVRIAMEPEARRNSKSDVV